MTGMRILAVAGGYPGWRAQALRALAAGWPPDAVTWTESDALPASAAGQMTLDYAPAPPAQTCAVAEPAAPVPAAPVRISRDFAALLQHAALYRSTQRWALLYRALWRWQNGDRSVASAADHDGARLHAMAKAVRRARHDMIAYVRFQQRAGGGMPEYLAWYEPGHDVLASAAEHFARRMGKSSWWIGTPHGSALWDGQAMHLSGLPADPAAMPATADQVEPLWLAYYQSIFNPARLNEAALVQHMPVRFWKGLPEGPLIPAMIAQARAGARRVGQAAAVGEMPGKPVPMEAGRAQPPRALPSTLDQCRRCELWRHATQAVPGCGPQGARIMLVGEQPGDQEDLAGQPFIGPAGQVLDDALRRAELARETVYLTNAVKHFKWVARGKRRMHKTPGQREVEACAAWLEEEIARVKPRVIVALGATALRAVLRRAAALQDHLDAPVLRGDALVMATYHPSYALRVQGVRTPAQVAAHIAETLARARQLAEATLPA